MVGQDFTWSCVPVSFGSVARMNWVREAFASRRTRQYNAPATARTATMATIRAIYRVCTFA
jgi:hypothetical protein